MSARELDMAYNDIYRALLEYVRVIRSASNSIEPERLSGSGC